MKRLLVLILTLLVCAPTYCEIGDSSNGASSGDWYSAKLCGFNGCVWRAITVSRDMTLAVDFYPNGKHHVSLISNVPSSALETWGEQNRDAMPARVRVDYTPIIETTFNRYFQREDMLLFYNFDDNQFGKGFINSLKRGQKVRIQLLADQGIATLSFSLRGASRALSRAQNNAWGTSQEKRDEDFFNTPMKGDSSNQQQITHPRKNVGTFEL